MDLHRPAVSDERIWIAKWVVADGSTVREADIICEFESTRATIEYPAPCDGILRHIAAPMVLLGWTEVFARILPDNPD